jgi:diacylglycerol kinase family enzyme
VATQFQNVHIIINPASGKDEPILNPINELFAGYEIPWEAHITHKPGDATRLTKEALDAGADLIVSYGGDGTLMEVVNGMVGRGVPLALLAGGTGNGVATELGIPTDLRQALQLIGESPARRMLDAGRSGDRYFMLRAFVGLPTDYVPDRQTKDSIGFLAYPISAVRFLNERPPVRYQIDIDGFQFEEEGILCLVNNVGYSNSPKRLQDMVERSFLDVQVHQGEETAAAEGLVLNAISPDDGLLDVIIVTGTKSLLQSLVTLPIRDRGEPLAKVHFFQGKRISIEATPVQEIRLDGEEGGETPCQIEVIPQAIEVIVSA